MEFMKIATLVIIAIFLILDWLSTLSKKWETYTKTDWLKCIVEPFCLIGSAIVSMELWG